MDSNFKTDQATARITELFNDGKNNNEIVRTLKKEGFKNRMGNLYSYKNVYDRTMNLAIKTPKTQAKTNNTDSVKYSTAVNDALKFINNITMFPWMSPETRLATIKNLFTSPEFGYFPNESRTEN